MRPGRPPEPDVQPLAKGIVDRLRRQHTAPHLAAGHAMVKKQAMGQLLRRHQSLSQRLEWRPRASLPAEA